MRSSTDQTFFPGDAVLDVPKLCLDHCINGQQDYTGNKEPDPGRPIKYFVQNLLEPKQSCLLVRNADLIQNSAFVYPDVCAVFHHIPASYPARATAPRKATNIPTIVTTSSSRWTSFDISSVAAVAFTLNSPRTTRLPKKLPKETPFFHNRMAKLCRKPHFLAYDAKKLSDYSIP